MTATTTDYVQFSEGAALGHQFRLRARTLSALTFPVPTLQPTVTGKPVALDLQPLGPNYVESAGHGWSWVDCCNADVMNNNNAPVVCGRVGVRTIDGVAAGYVGTYTFNGAGYRNFYLCTGDAARWGVSFDPGHFFPYATDAVTLGLDTRRILDVFLTGRGSLQDKLAAYETRIASLEATVIAQDAKNADFESRLAALEI